MAKILILQGSIASVQCLSVAQDCSEDAPGSRGFLKMWQSCLQKEASEGWPWPAKLLSICIGTEWCRRGAFPGPGLRHGRWPAAVPQASLPSVLSALSAFCAVAIFHCKKLRALVPRPIVQLGDYEDALEIRVPRPKHLVPRMQTCSRAGWPRNASRGKVCAPKYSFMVFKQNGLTTTKRLDWLLMLAVPMVSLQNSVCELGLCKHNSLSDFCNGNSGFTVLQGAARSAQRARVRLRKAVWAGTLHRRTSRSSVFPFARVHCGTCQHRTVPMSKSNAADNDSIAMDNGNIY